MIRFFMWSGLLCAVVCSMMLARLAMVRDQPTTGRLIMVRAEGFPGAGDFYLLTEDTRWMRRMEGLVALRGHRPQAFWMRGDWMYVVTYADHVAPRRAYLQRVNLWAGVDAVQRLPLDRMVNGLILGWLDDQTLVLYTTDLNGGCRVGVVDLRAWTFSDFAPLNFCYDTNTVLMMRYPAHIVINDTYTYAWQEHPQTGGPLTTADWIALPPQYVTVSSAQPTGLPMGRLTAPYYFSTDYNLFRLSPAGGLESLAERRTATYGIPFEDDVLVWEVGRGAARGYSGIWREDEQHPRTRITPPSAYVVGSATDATGRYAYFLVTHPEFSYWRLDTQTGALETVLATQCLLSDYHLNVVNRRYRYCEAWPPSLAAGAPLNSALLNAAPISGAPLGNLDFVGYVAVPSRSWRLGALSGRVLVGVALFMGLVLMGWWGRWR